MLNIEINEKSYKGKVILHNIKYTFNNGLYVIKGYNGCGKTTLLRLISFLDTKFDGEIDYGNINSNSSIDSKDKFRKNNIFYCKPANNLLSFLNVEENLSLDNPNYSSELLEEIPLKAYPNELSGGQQMLVAISKLISTTKQYLFLDEITSQLDDENTVLVFNLFKKLSKSKTIILVTHDSRILKTPGINLLELKDGELYDKNR